MSFAVFESLPIIIIYVCVAFVMLISCEIGYQLGKRFRTVQDKEAQSSVSPMVGGLLGMLAFVLAFTFSIAASHHSSRKENVLDEANAIGTAYLRSDLLEMKYQTKVKQLLREYVSIRLQSVIDIHEKGISEVNVKAVLKRSVAIHYLLWDLVSEAAIKTPSFNTSLMI